MERSLKNKLTLFVVGLLLVLAVLLSGVSYLQLRSQLLDAVEREAMVAAKGNGSLITDWVASKRQQVKAMVPIASRPDALGYFQRAAEGGGFDLVYAGFPDKKMVFSTPQNLPPGYDPTTRPWYRMAAAGTGTILTEPYSDAATGNLVVSFAAPVQGPGGVSAVVAADITITRLVKDILALRLGGNGYAMLLSRDGKIIAHPDPKLALKGIGEISGELAGQSSRLAQPSGGLVDARVGGKASLVLWQPVEGTDWTLALVMERSSVLAPLDRLLMKILGIVAVFGAGVSLLAVVALNHLLRGLLQIRNAMREIAGGGGDLTRKLEVASQDEVGQTADAFNRFLAGLRETIREVKDASTSVASGATELSSSADQMSTTTGEIAKSGELLHGVTDSVAAATVQFQASVDHVAGNVKDSVEDTEKAVQATVEGAKGAQAAAKGMERIREATTRISSAVAVIREIAQQTNLLSLNAAIEAAKAGEQGKGFAVVAEEVRKLADRSRQATVEIEALIQETHGAVEEGGASVGATLELMNHVQETITHVSTLVHEIGVSTQEQARTASEIAQRMEESAREVGQNAAATQELSATVEEISRTASELARVSNSLATVVGGFKV